MRSFCAFTLFLFAAHAATPGFEAIVQPFVAVHCLGCHNEKLSSGGLNLKRYPDSKSFLSGREDWEHVLDKIKSGQMPPKGVPRPPAVQAAAVTAWLESEFARQDRNAPVDPGRVTARRLNRYEYNATIQDLLGLEYRPADDFPADDFGYGFDGIADILSVSPVLMEKYMTAAKRVARAAIDPDPVPKKPVVARTNNLAEHWPFTWDRTFLWEGDYEIRFAVPYFVDGRHDPGTLFIGIDDAAPMKFPLATEYGNEGRFQDVKLHLSYGRHRLKAWGVRDDEAVIKDEWTKEQSRQERAKRAAANPEAALPTAGANPNPNGASRQSKELAKPPVPMEEIERKVRSARQPFIEFVEVHGPYDPKPAPRPESYRRIFVCGHPEGQHTAACVRSNLAVFARRAWRGPVSAAEVAKLESFVRMAQADGTDEAMKVGVTAVLVSPRFLFRMEQAPARGERRLSDVELASRLSYFLWSSIPDEDLLKSAEEGKLGRPEVLEAQVRRMLADPKSDRLVENFGGQWLLIRNLDNIHPDPDKFPAFTNQLRYAMKEETRLFFSNILREDRSILDFLTAKYTFINEPLAKLYGIPGVTGGEFRKVDLTGTPRVGILTQGSVLTVSSYPTRTSPVLRGKWILENLLNAPPPPPPGDVPSLDASGAGATGTVRQQLEKHRADPVCSSCHSKMDPLGFGLENFDAIGNWRTMEGKFAIDSTGTMPDGKTFSTPEQLVGMLAADQAIFARALTEKLLTFGLGRGLEGFDRPAVSEIVRHAGQKDYRFSSLILEIAASPPFRMRRAEAAKGVSR